MRRLLLMALLASVPALSQWSALPNTTFNNSVCVANGFAGSVCPSGAVASITSCGGLGTPYPYQAQCSAMIRAYNGAIARTKPGSEMLVVWGNGHGDGGDNSVVGIRVSGTTSISRLRDPSPLNEWDPAYWGPLSATVSTNGTAVTWISGTQFPLQMSGIEISIGGVTHLIQTVNSATALTLYTSAGVQASVNLSIAGSIGRFVARDGNPPGTHSYNNMTYVDETDPYFPDHLFAFGGSTYGLGSHSNVGWFYDFATNLWKRVVPATGGFQPQKPLYIAAPTFYDKAQRKIWIIDNGHVVDLDLASCTGTTTVTCTYTTHGQSATAVMWPGAAFDTTRRRIITMGGGDSKAYRVDLSGGYGTTDITASIGASCNTPLTSTGPGMIYDPVQDQIVIYPSNSGGTLYFMNPVTYACTSTAYTGGPPNGSITNQGHYGRFAHFPSLGKLVTLNDFGQATYAISYGVAAPSTQNTITIKNEGTTTTNYPVQIGRAFACSEIPSGSLPQAYIDGVGYVPTQVDVKVRHLTGSCTDNSLRHAIISFLLPTFTSGVTYTVRFAAGSTVGNTALTQAQMLDAAACPSGPTCAFNFNAHIALTRTGVTQGADETNSARTMLMNGDYTVWASGPIATTILLGNHAQGATCGSKAASAYDFGFDSFCAFRPLFRAIFWAGTNQVSVRAVGEIANTEQLEDVIVDDIVFTVGNTSPTTAYDLSAGRAPLTMNAGSRWTKTAWIGGTPPVVSINHNLAYLKTTKALPNYDTSKTVSAGTITTSYSAWTAAAKDLYQRGQWDDATSGGFGGGGGHSYVAPYPAETVQFLYTGDYRLFEQAVGNAELLASMEWHLREGKAGKKLDRAGAVNGVGYPISVSTRPSFVWANFADGDNSWASAGDKVTPVGTATMNAAHWDAARWGNIISHQPEPWEPLYVVTGDPFFLEEGQFQAAWNATYYHSYNWRARGPTGAEGGIPDRGQQIVQTRGQGWIFRNRVETAWVTPDADPFKAYLEQLIADAIAYWEGQRGITGTAYQGNALWNYGASTTTYAPDATDRQWYPAGTSPSPLHFWDNGSLAVCYTSTFNCNGLPVNDTAVVGRCNSPWMENYVLYSLGRGAELGYASTALRNWLGANPIGAITDGGYNPYLAGAYRSNIVTAGGSYFATWASSKTGYISQVQTETGFEPGAACTSGGANSNVHPLAAAVSMVADQPGGGSAWSWVNTHVLQGISNDLKWAIMPRSTASTPTSRTSGAGAVRGGRIVK